MPIFAFVNTLAHSIKARILFFCHKNAAPVSSLSFSLFRLNTSLPISFLWTGRSLDACHCSTLVVLKDESFCLHLNLLQVFAKFSLSFEYSSVFCKIAIAVFDCVNFYWLPVTWCHSIFCCIWLYANLLHWTLITLSLVSTIPSLPIVSAHCL